MSRISQVGIALSLLGAMIMLMGLFPGITGVAPTSGVGIVQLFVTLIGFTLLIFGALVYVKFAFYANQRATLAQQIGTRLALTGLVLAGIAAFSDALGFGSHGAQFTEYQFLGPLQATGIIASFLLSCLGVLVYAVGGNLNREHFDDEDEA
jgi:putative Mn2+ efflux pump MntP